MRAKRDLRFRAMVKISDDGSGLAFADYCANREDAILFCLTQARRFPDAKTAAWVDQLLPEERRGLDRRTRYGLGASRKCTSGI